MLREHAQAAAQDLRELYLLSGGHGRRRGQRIKTSVLLARRDFLVVSFHGNVGLPAEVNEVLGSIKGTFERVSVNGLDARERLERRERFALGVVEGLFGHDDVDEDDESQI